MIDYLRLTAVALVLTIVIESGIAWIFGLRSKPELLTIVFINIVTNPLLNYLILINAYFHLIAQGTVLVLALEVIVVLVEWRLLSWVLRKGTKKMLALSLVMNGCSYSAGLLLLH